MHTSTRWLLLGGLVLLVALVGFLVFRQSAARVRTQLAPGDTLGGVNCTTTWLWCFFGHTRSCELYRQYCEKGTRMIIP